MEEPIFLHSSSVLKKEMPEWVVYQEVYETNKMYMRGVTAIEPEWLPMYAPNMCNLSEPLSDPPPRYDPVTGKVHCRVNGTFGRAALTLPTMEIPFTQTLDSYKWFARFLLNGEVFPKLQKYTNSLLSSPTSMTKSWSKLQPRTEILLKALVSKEANNRDQLIKIWEENSYYLLDAYKSWLPDSAHESLTLIWPPIWYVNVT
ncbi:UNVERIFIED_CONTAM: hypothetical protein PYX00_009521 [Menopon gallinae]|uniref:ATP-dependent RNA helicase DHX37 n=1 Tax=Menopon gallinae TaxID=328185 RepID=A0AAW2HBC4_9NEOP